MHMPPQAPASCQYALLTTPHCCFSPAICSMGAAFGAGVCFSFVSGVPNPVQSALTTGAAFAGFNGLFYQVGQGSICNSSNSSSGSRHSGSMDGMAVKTVRQAPHHHSQQRGVPAESWRGTVPGSILSAALFSSIAANRCCCFAAVSRCQALRAWPGFSCASTLCPQSIDTTTVWPLSRQ